jgi:hypothetical protein
MGEEENSYGEHVDLIGLLLFPMEGEWTNYVKKTCKVWEFHF